MGVPCVSPTWTIEPQSKREERHRNLLCPCTRDCPSCTSPHACAISFALLAAVHGTWALAQSALLLASHQLAMSVGWTEWCLGCGVMQDPAVSQHEALDMLPTK